MKKSLVLLLALSMLLTMILVGCSGDETTVDNGETTAPATDDPDSVSISGPGEYPITTDDVTLEVLMGGHANVEDFNTNEYSLWYEEKTGVKVVYEELPVVDGNDRLNLILATGEYPDVISAALLTTSQIMSYGSQGIFVPMNDYVDRQGYEIKQVFAEPGMAYVEDLMTFPDGNMYSLPDINQCYHCSMAMKLWIYQPWLDELGLDMPTTLNEYKDVLIAFRDNDPNGNGIADEIPLAGCATGGWFSQFPGFFMNSFIYNNNGKSITVNDGVLDTSFDKPEWREGLTYLNDLYNEGLLSPESFTQDGDQYRSMGENPEIPILGSGIGGHQGIMAQFYGESGRWLDFVIVPPLESPDGKRPTSYYDPYQASFNSIITEKCENPEIAFKWLDGHYEMEAMLRSIFGRPDQEWRWAEEGELGLDGNPALYALLVPWSETTQNYCWMQSGNQARTPEFRFGEMANPEEPLETLLLEATHLYDEYRPDHTQVLPPLVFTEEQSNELADLEITILDFVEQMNARFITGDASLESDWDNYIETLNSMNLERFLEIHQEAYDAKFGE